jgi:hypothetical protein
MRVALNDAAPLYRDAPEASDARAAGAAAIAAFMRETLPRASPAPRARAAERGMDTFTAVGKQFSERPRTPDEIAAYADALADMLCAWLERLAAR